MPKDQNYQRTKFAFDKVKAIATSTTISDGNKKDYKSSVEKLPLQLRNDLIRRITIIKANAKVETHRVITQKLSGVLTVEARNKLNTEKTTIEQNAQFILYKHLSDWLNNDNNKRYKILDSGQDLLDRMLSDEDSSTPSIHQQTIKEELIELATWLKNHAKAQILDS